MNIAQDNYNVALAAAKLSEVKGESQATQNRKWKKVFQAEDMLRNVSKGGF